ncbi:hypothetical protein [Undibacterium sp. RuTC16W]|uniref:hypothetical protein n=1 Tax=Undibacterium sp. RuTC16W TaxID=3413048 RepID=UPI003BF3ABAA
MNEPINFCSTFERAPQFITVFLQQPETSWLSLLTAFVTPVIAALGIWIAYQQATINRHKLKLDLYDKRLEIYNAVRNALGTIVMSGQTSQSIEREFLIGIAGAKWLFNKEIKDYLNETLWLQIINLGSLQGQLDGLERGTEKTELSKKRTEVMNALNKRLSELDDMFYEFLHLKA